MRQVSRYVFVGLLATLVFAGAAWADFPLGRIISFNRVEADPNKRYEVTEDLGPWMILAATFSGETAEYDAHQLILELRREFKLEAYLCCEILEDLTKPVQARGVDEYGRPLQARHAQAVELVEYGVLVGSYESLESRELERDLERIKTLHPVSLDLERGNGRSLKYGEIRAQYREVTGDTERGPMGRAFAVHNPAIDEEFFQQVGIDPVVLEMNEQAEYTLLECPGRFTVQVACFRGRNLIQQSAIAAVEEGRAEFDSRLEEAALKAHLMAGALRRDGCPEAYEYHDLQESVVCVGSFDYLYELDPNQPYVLDELGRQRPNFRVDSMNRPVVNPAILELVRRFGPQQGVGPNGQPVVGNQPRTIEVHDGQQMRILTFDLAPIPVVVPKRAMGDEYARGGEGRFFWQR